jgi:hypothetical protein
VRRDVFSRSSIGGMFANRSVSLVADGGSNQTYGLDGSFSRGDVTFAGYYAQTRTPDLDGDDASYLSSLNYNGDLLGASASFLRVDSQFNPEVGFLRRRGFEETSASARISPRPASIEWLRRLSLQGNVSYLENQAGGFVESRDRQGRFTVELESSDVVDFGFNDTYEFLEDPFRISGVTVPPGEYAFQDWEVALGLGLQRWYSGTVSYQWGEFYDGTRRTLGLRTGRINVSDRMSLEPSLSFNSVELPGGSFRNDLAVTRINYAFTPRMFFGGLVQYNSASNSVSTNMRLRWEYMPGSELFIVYTEARDTEPELGDRWSELANRGFTIKLNYLLRP